MNVKLRKRHRMMWLVLGIGLPLLCLQAIESIPQRNIAQIPIISCPADITDCGVAERYEIFEQVMDIKVLPGDNFNWVQIDFDQPLVSAFTVAYLDTNADGPSEEAVLLGGLNGMGSYSFKVPANLLNSNQQLLIVDKLKARTLFVQDLNTLQP